MQVIGDDGDREQRRHRGRCRPHRGGRDGAGADETKSDRSDRMRRDLAGRDRPFRPLAAIDRPIEIIVEIHAADVERRHRNEHEAEPPVAPIAAAEHRAGQDIGPHRRQIGDAAESEQRGNQQRRARGGGHCSPSPESSRRPRLTATAVVAGYSICGCAMSIAYTGAVSSAATVWVSCVQLSRSSWPVSRPATSVVTRRISARWRAPARCVRSQP